MELLQLAPWKFELVCWQFAVDFLLNGVEYECYSAIEEHRRNSFFSTHFLCKKAVNPCKESVLHHSIFPISVKLGTIVKGNKR